MGIRSDKMKEDATQKEYKRIKSLNNENLLQEFETNLRNSAGEQYLPVIWARKEILLRMDEGELV